jgi:hypothetical protein
MLRLAKPRAEDLYDTYHSCWRAVKIDWQTTGPKFLAQHIVR